MATLQTRDWSLLPPEILESIAANFTIIPDLVLFSSVCLQWRSAAKSVSSRLPRQFPWLLLLDRTATDRLFVDLADSRTYKFPLPGSHRTRAKTIHPTPTGGWILTPRDIETLALVNPLTRSSIPLPPLPLTESQRKIMGAYGLKKAKLFGSGLVAVHFRDHTDILICRLRDNSWKRIEPGKYEDHTDFVYHDGRMFFIRRYYYMLLVFDVHTLERIGEFPLDPLRQRWGDDYLVESPQGKLLLVRRNLEEEGKRFEVYWLVTSGERIACVELSSIGDNALFVDCFQAMAFCAGDMEGCRQNCIYFVNDLGQLKGKHKDQKGNGSGVMVFDIEKGEIERSPLFSFTSRGHWGKAMWVVPTLG